FIPKQKSYGRVGNFFYRQVVKLPFHQLRINWHRAVMKGRILGKFRLSEGFPGLIHINRGYQHKEIKQPAVGCQFPVYFQSSIVYLSSTQHLEIGDTVRRMQPDKLKKTLA